MTTPPDPRRLSASLSKTFRHWAIRSCRLRHPFETCHGRSWSCRDRLAGPEVSVRTKVWDTSCNVTESLSRHRGVVRPALNFESKISRKRKISPEKYRISSTRKKMTGASATTCHGPRLWTQRKDLSKMTPSRLRSKLLLMHRMAFAGTLRGTLDSSGSRTKALPATWIHCCRLTILLSLNSDDLMTLFYDTTSKWRCSKRLIFLSWFCAKF